MILAMPRSREPLFADAAELRRIRDGAGGDDAALAGHEPRHRHRGAESARIGERHRAAREIVGHQLVAARLGDESLVGGMEGREIKGVGALDDGHHEAAGAVLALDVDGEAESEVGRGVAERGAVGRAVAVPHDGVLLPRQDQRVRDQMGERELDVAARGGERGVEARALGLQGGDRELSEGGRGGDAEALLHVGGEPRGRAFDLYAFSGRAATVWAARCSRAGRWQLDAGSWRLLANDACLEEGLPLRGNRGRIAQKVFVQRLGEAGVGGFERVNVGRFHEVKSNQGRKDGTTERRKEPRRFRLSRPPSFRPSVPAFEKLLTNGNAAWPASASR